MQFGAVEIPIGVPAADQTLNILARIDERAQLVGSHAASAFSRLAVPTRVVSSMGEAAAGSENLLRKVEHLGVAGSFAITNLATGTEGGLTRAAHSLALFGGAFGPTGLLLTTFVAVAGEKLIQWFSEAGKKADELKDKFLKDLGEMANAADAVKINKTARDLFFGTPYDKDGKFVEASERVKGAFKGSLADMEAELQSFRNRTPANLIDALAIKAKIDALEAALAAPRAQMEALQKAANNLLSQPSGTPGQLAAPTATATSPDKERAAIMARYKQQLDALEAAAKETQRAAEQFLKDHPVDTSFYVDREGAKAKEAARKAAEDRFYAELDADEHRFIEHQRKVGEQAAELARSTAAVISDAMKGLYDGGLTGGLKALGDGLLKQLGEILVRVGEKMLAAAPIFQAISTALLALDGAGLALGGAALIALGATMGAAAGGGGSSGAGRHGGGSSNYGSGYNYQATVTPSYLPNMSGVKPAAPLVVNATIIGKDDPKAQRDLLQLIARAERRGSTSG